MYLSIRYCRVMRALFTVYLWECVAWPAGLYLLTGWRVKDNSRPRSWRPYGSVTFLGLFLI